MEKSEKLYRYISECFTTDVMCSIFLENYEYMNQTFFYSDLLNKFDAVSKYLLEEASSDEIVERKIAELKKKIDDLAVEIIIYRFMVYYSGIIDKKYLLDKKKNVDLACLTQNYTNAVEERMKLTNEFTEVLEQNLSERKASVDFFLSSVNKLREFEETIFKMIMEG